MSENTSWKILIHEAIEKIAQYHENSENFLLINGYISNMLFLSLYDEVKHLKSKDNDIFVIINSFGGSAEGAYKIIKQIRKSFNKVYGIIPLCANSAATLIGLGFDKIYFSSLGEMSPLDVQISRKSEGDTPVRQSALDHASSIKEILSIAFHTYKEHYKNLPDFLKEVDRIELASDYSNKMIEPLLNQVNPLELGNVARSNKVALDYGKRILERYKKWKPDEAEEFMNKVIHYYPSHSSIIDEEELKRLGFTDVKTKDYPDVDFDFFKKLLVEIDISFVKYHTINKKGVKVDPKKTDGKKNGGGDK